VSPKKPDQGEPQRIDTIRIGDLIRGAWRLFCSGALYVSERSLKEVAVILTIVVTFCALYDRFIGAQQGVQPRSQGQQITTPAPAPQDSVNFGEGSVPAGERTADVPPPMVTEEATR
jgi:hypothetical protein